MDLSCILTAALPPQFKTNSAATCAYPQIHQQMFKRFNAGFRRFGGKLSQNLSETLGVYRVSVVSRPISRMEPDQRIIHVAFDLFTRYGIRNVTMDDIARELGMSKKTLYQHYEDKAAIVLASAEGFFEREACLIQEIEQQGENAVHELVLIMNWMGQNLKNMSPSLMYEVQRYYPEAWKVFDKHRQENALQAIIRNLKRGMEEGLFRSELDAELVARLRIASYSHTNDSGILPQDRYSFIQIQEVLFDLYLHSIATPAGLERYHQYRQHSA